MPYLRKCFRVLAQNLHSLTVYGSDANCTRGNDTIRQSFYPSVELSNVRKKPVLTG